MSSSCGPSCFGGSPVSGDEEDRQKISRFWSRLRGKNKTVPADSSPENGVPPAAVGGVEEFKSKVTGPATTVKASARKTTRDCTHKSEAKNYRQHHKKPSADTSKAPVNSTSQQNKPCTHCINPNSNSRTQLAPLHRRRPTITTATTRLSSHNYRNKCEVIARLLLLGVTLAVWRLFNRAFAFACMSARVASYLARGAVLQGSLERKDCKPSTASSGA